jgi:glucans biosynthesis protein
VHFRKDAPTRELGLYVTSTRAGEAHFAKGEDEKLLFVVDYAGDLKSGKGGESRRVGDMPRATVSASDGRIENVNVRNNKETGGLRVSFELFPEQAKVVDLRLDLLGLPSQGSETWLYRWAKPK